MSKLQHLAITIIGRHTQQLPGTITRTISDCGCDISDCRMSVLGQELTLLMLLSGNWDAIAKVEDALNKLQADNDLTVSIRRTEHDKPPGSMLPYAVDVICPNKIGVHSKLIHFFIENEISIHDFYSTTYEASQTGTTMFSMHLNIHIPLDVSVSSLRNDFMEFCDQFNLDAIMEPIK